MYLLPIDFSFIFHKSYSIINYYYQPKGEDGKPIKLDLLNPIEKGFMIRKVVMDLCSIINELDGDEVVFAFDDLSFRYDLLETYKGGRGDKVPGFSDTIQEVHDIMQEKGLNVLKIKGLEGDDVLALIANDPRFEKYIKMIVTRDEDMRQLINEKTFVYDPDSKKKTFYYGFDSQIKFKPKEGEQYNYVKVDPFFILFMKILKGCSTDKIPQLTPKGYRTKKIEEMYSYLLNNLATIDSFEDAIFNAINSLDLKIGKEEFLHQLKMVYLCGDHLPEGKMKEYMDNFNLKKATLPYTMQDILKGTEYINEDYEKNKK